MPKTKEEIKEELVEWFGERIETSRYFEDYARIGSFLSDPAHYITALRQLHLEMELLFDERTPGHSGGHLLNWPRNRALAKLYRDSPPGATDGFLKKLFRKLLTNVLVENERRNGFKVGVDDSQVDILIGLSGKLFNQLLRNKRPFKDIGASQEHGENSHRIQWYLISKIHDLKNPVAEIYAKLTGWKTQEVHEPSGRHIYMWEFLVDRDGIPSNVTLPIKTDHQTDFRAPSNVNRCLKDGYRDPVFYLLEACLSHRWAKRESTYALSYFCKKLRYDIASLDEKDVKSILNGDMAVIFRSG